MRSCCKEAVKSEFALQWKAAAVTAACGGENWSLSSEVPSGARGSGISMDSRARPAWF